MDDNHTEMIAQNQNILSEKQKLETEFKQTFLKALVIAIAGKEDTSLAHEHNLDYLAKLRQLVNNELEGHLQILAHQQGKHLDTLPALGQSPSPDQEKDFLETLVRNIHVTQNAESGGITPRISRDLNGMDCSMSTWVMQYEARKAGLRFEFGAPVGHAVGVVTLSSGEILYADGQNGFIEPVQVTAKQLNGGARILKNNNYEEIQKRQPRFFPEFVLVGPNVDLASTVTNIDSMLYKQYTGEFTPEIIKKLGRDLNIVKQMQPYAKEFQAQISSDIESKSQVNNLQNNLFPELAEFRGSKEARKDIQRRG